MYYARKSLVLFVLLAGCGEDVEGRAPNRERASGTQREAARNEESAAASIVLRAPSTAASSKPIPPYYFEDQADVIAIGVMGRATLRGRVEQVQLDIREIIKGALPSGKLETRDRMPSFSCNPPPQPLRPSGLYAPGTRVAIYLKRERSSGWYLLHLHELRDDYMAKWKQDVQAHLAHLQEVARRKAVKARLGVPTLVLEYAEKKYGVRWAERISTALTKRYFPHRDFFRIDVPNPQVALAGPPSGPATVSLQNGTVRPVGARSLLASLRVSTSAEARDIVRLYGHLFNYQETTPAAMKRATLDIDPVRVSEAPDGWRVVAHLSGQGLVWRIKFTMRRNGGIVIHPAKAVFALQRYR